MTGAVSEALNLGTGLGLFSPMCRPSQYGDVIRSMLYVFFVKMA